MHIALYFMLEFLFLSHRESPDCIKGVFLCGNSNVGGLQPKKNRKKPKKTSPKFEICGSVRFFSVFFGFFSAFFVFFRFFSVFFGFFRFFVVLFRFFSV